MTSDGACESLGATGVEQRFFRTLNRFVEPVVRAGLGSSAPGPGAFVVETTGRRSGLPRPVVLLGQRFGHNIIVSTTRHRSQWIRNLEHHPFAEVWVAGRRRRVTATVVRLPGTTLARLRLRPLIPVAHHLPQREDVMIERVSKRWHNYLRGGRPGGLDELLADEVVC